MTRRDRHLLFGLAGLTLALAALTLVGVHSDVLLAAPVLSSRCRCWPAATSARSSLARLAAAFVAARRRPAATLVPTARRAPPPCRAAAAYRRLARRAPAAGVAAPHRLARSGAFAGRSRASIHEKEGRRWPVAPSSPPRSARSRQRSSPHRPSPTRATRTTSRSCAASRRRSPASPSRCSTATTASRSVNRSSQHVTIDGYNAASRTCAWRPTARSRSTSARRRTTSTRTASAARRSPHSADPKAPPQWKVVARNGRYEFHDHRMHWMAKTVPQQVKDASMRTKIFDWKVPLQRAGRRRRDQRRAVLARLERRRARRRVRRLGCSCCSAARAS